MKNRLQFNRLYALFNNRDEALTAFTERITDENFIPLIGEPIVLRYKDGDDVRLMLAIGKKKMPEGEAASGITYDEYYQIVDVNEIDDAIESLSGSVIAAESVINSFTGGSGITITGDHEIRIKLANKGDVDLIKLDESGLYLSGVASVNELRQLSGNTLDELASLSARCDDIEEISAAAFNDLNARIAQVASGSSADVTALSGALVDDEVKLQALSGAVEDFSGATDAKFIELSAYTKDVDDKVKALSAGTIQLSADTKAALDAISTGITPDIIALSGSIESLSAATVVLETGLNNLSAAVVTDIVYDASARTISLKNSSDQTVGTPISTNDFIIDGMLDDVQVIETSGGTVLHFVFNTDAGSKVIDIPVSDFAAIYEAGSGITITDDNKIEVKLANKGDSSFIGLDNDGLYLTGVSAMNDNITALSASVVDNKADIASVSAAVDSLSAKVVDDELVTSAALNDLNDRISDLDGRMMDPADYYTKDETYDRATIDQKIASGGTFDPANYYNKSDINTLSGRMNADIVALSGAVVGDEAKLRALSAGTVSAINALSGDVQNIYEVIEENEYVTSRSLNDLNLRILELSGNSSNVSTQIQSLEEIIEQDEYVTSQSLNDLNLRLLELSAKTGTTMEALTNLSGSAEGLRALSAVVVDDALVIAAALNDLNERISDDEGEIESLANSVAIISAVTSSISGMPNIDALSASVVSNKSQITTLTNRVNSLSGSVVTNKTNINTVSGDVISLSAAMISDELVIAAALNDLNDRVIELSGNTGGGGGQANVQSDWDESDPTSDAYILNKPFVPSIVKLTTVEYNALANKDPDTLYILVD